MIFTIIMLSISLVGFVVSLLVDTDSGAEILFAGFFLLLSAICILFLILGPLCSREVENTIMRMRINPEAFSIQDASDVNMKLTEIDRWKDTIFTFHRGFDTTLLDLSKFVSI